MNNDTITIDGSIGEGGGQILRTSLTLAAITGRKLVIENIRANRKKPGLMRQHRTCVLAAAKACNAKVEGSELGSTKLSFTPNSIQAGEFEFSIGTAGSTVLVAQTLMPILLFAAGESTVKLTGGTHNDMSPSLCFFTRSYLPVLKHMGVAVDVHQTSYGFNPAGGGVWQLKVKPLSKLKPVTIKEVELCEQDKQINVLHSKIPIKVCQREIETVCEKLNWPIDCASTVHAESPGAGNSVQVITQGQYHQNMIEVFGQYGLPADRVARRAAKQMNTFLHSQASVTVHLADQLLLPMALAGSGSFTTSKPSQHTLTNIAVIEQFLAIKIEVDQIDDFKWKITIES